MNTFDSATVGKGKKMILQICQSRNVPPKTQCRNCLTGDWWSGEGVGDKKHANGWCVQISEVCTHVTKVVCANTANIYVAKVQMYNLRLGTGTSWSNTGSGGREGTLQKWWESQMWSCSLALLDFKETPCCILFSEPPNLSSCPAPLDFKKTFVLLHPFP